MEQIYYTQCPIGYGLGASNGYQVKRISPEYPATADFHHLGLRAFVGGTRRLAPTTLRYRRDGDVAEIAWLTPRDREFETEKGRWGRPGGHFAHGIRLDRREFHAIHDWPAGLIDSPVWKRSDPEPSRGREPEAIALDEEAMTIAPTFAAVAGLASGMDRDWLAGIFAATAMAVREDRTLFLIGEADAIPRLIALITFVFPDFLRADLTFSTYNDRPEELSGFRIQGMSIVARSHRAAMTSTGIVADLEDRSIEPNPDPHDWAFALADWFLVGDAIAEKSWRNVRSWAGQVTMEAGDSAWSDEWLGSLVALDGVAASAKAMDPPWPSLEYLAGWSCRRGLADLWRSTFPPSWWMERSGAAGLCEAGRALCATVRLPELWHSVRPEEWGRVLGVWFKNRPLKERQEAISAGWRGASESARKRFLVTMLAAFSPPVAEETLGWLRSQSTFPDALLLPLQAQQASRKCREARGLETLSEILSRAATNPATLVASLDAMAAEVQGDSRAIAIVGTALADALEEASTGSRCAAETWALRRKDGGSWLHERFRRLFGQVENRDAWEELRDGAHGSLWPSLAYAVLGTTRDESLPDEAFLWGVEQVLLRIEENRRPHDPSWPDTYLRRTRSGFTLFQKFYIQGRLLEIKRWIAQAKERGEISVEQLERFRQVRSFARVLASRDAHGLLEIDLPEVHPRDRGKLLGQMLGHLRDAGDGTMEVCLESCRAAWPGGFDPGAEGLLELARPVAEALMPFRGHPAGWFASLCRILERLHLTDGDGKGFESNSFAAQVLAVANRLDDRELDAWKLREFVLHRDQAWKILAVDAGYDLNRAESLEVTQAFEKWDAKLDKRGQSARFFELMLNASDGPSRTVVLAARVADVLTLDRLSWWNASETSGAEDDLRDAFARTAPMAPLPEQSLAPLRKWMTSAPLLDPSSKELFDPDRQSAKSPASLARISTEGLSRWQCLAALSALARKGMDAGGRWSIIGSWDGAVPLRSLADEDKYRFLARVIVLLEEFDHVSTESLARWLVREQVIDASRVSRWAEELPDPDRTIVAHRVAFVSDLSAAIRDEKRRVSGR